MPASAPGITRNMPARPAQTRHAGCAPSRGAARRRYSSRSRGRQYDLPIAVSHRNIAATEPRAHIGQASDFSPI